MSPSTSDGRLLKMFLESEDFEIKIFEILEGLTNRFLTFWRISSEGSIFRYDEQWWSRCRSNRTSKKEVKRRLLSNVAKLLTLSSTIIDNKMYPESGPRRIVELLNNNHAPSNQAAQEVKRLLLQPFKDLEDLDSEILELRNRLLELESKRNETQNQIFRYQSILAPIRRVPADVLGEIFYQCLPTHRNPIMKSTDCPLLLTRVCSTWRATAISTPKLWDRLYITFADYDTVPALETFVEMVRNRERIVGLREYTDMWYHSQPQADKQNTTQLLFRRYEAVKEWLLRSGTRPLSIAIYLTSADWYTIPYSERPLSATAKLLSFLASLAPRWKKFELEASFHLYKALEDMLPVSEMTTLTSFQVTCNDYEVHHTEPPGLKLLDAPNLHQITMMSMGYDTIWRDAGRPFTQWDKLTHITCYNDFSDQETMFLFEHAINLVHYEGFIQQNSFENILRTHRRLVSLPFLRNLSLSESDSPGGSSRIFALIDAPKLRHFEYNNNYDDGSFFSEWDIPGPISLSILPLLQKSAELESLSITISYLQFWDVGALLRAIPSVTNLVIGGQARSKADIYSVAYTDYAMSGILHKHLWSFRDLIVDDSDTILLPRLNSLFLANGTISISDATLFDLIKSRIKSSKVASLTRIKAYLYRERQRNIVDELRAYAESVGVDINLDFAYAQKHPYIQPTFADFGLVENANDFDEWSSAYS